MFPRMEEWLQKEEMIEQMKLKREGIVDVSSNWEDIPKLGDYFKVIKKER